MSERDLANNANEALIHLQKFGWPEDWPERPEAITFDDLELWHAYRKHDRGERLGKEETEQLTLQHQWRSAVWTVESRASSRLQTLMGVLSTLERLDRGEDAARVRNFVRQQFKLNLPIPAPQPHFQETRRMCEHFGRNFKLMPIHIRRNTKPPEDYQPPPPPQQTFGGAFAEDD